MFIYKITNQLSGKSYVGYDTSNLDNRWRDHKRDYLNERYNNKLLYRAMIKHGVERFLYERIEDNIESLEKLKEREIYWIAEYKSFGINGYNMTKGGDGGCRNKTFLENATKEELEIFSKRMSDLRIEFFQNPEKRQEWKNRAIELNLAQYIINGRDAGRKKWWSSLTDERRFEYQSVRSTGWWGKLTEQKQKELSEQRKTNGKKYYASLTELEKNKRIEKHKDKISGTYKITYPDGRTIITNRLKDLCKSGELNITYASLKVSEKKTDHLRVAGDARDLGNN